MTFLSSNPSSALPHFPLRMDKHATDIAQTTPDSSTISTSVWIKCDSKTVLEQLHEFEALINLNPLVKTINPLTEDNPHSRSYEIVDQLPFFGISLSQTYTATFIPSEDGVSVSIKAGLGVYTTSRWVVEECGPEVVKVSETSHVECCRLLRSYVVSQIKASHLVLFQKLSHELEGLKPFSGWSLFAILEGCQKCWMIALIC